MFKPTLPVYSRPTGHCKLLTDRLHRLLVLRLGCLEERSRLRRRLRSLERRIEILAKAAETCQTAEVMR